MVKEKNILCLCLNLLLAGWTEAIPVGQLYIVCVSFMAELYICRVIFRVETVMMWRVRMHGDHDGLVGSYFLVVDELMIHILDKNGIFLLLRDKIEIE